MITEIGMCGNSEAIRIPKAIVSLLGLERDDEVEGDINERDDIEISLATQQHMWVLGCEWCYVRVAIRWLRGW